MTWPDLIATYDARELLIARLTQVEDEGYLRLIGALAFLYRRPV